MTDILLIFSFILNGIALFCIVILYLRQNRFLEIEKKQEKMISELEDVVSAYMLEMNEENEKFLNKLKELLAEKNKSVHLQKHEEQGIIAENTYATQQRVITKNLNDEPKKTPVLRRGNHFQAINAYKTITIKGETDNKTPIETPSNKTDEQEQKRQESKDGELSAYAQAFELKKQGLSIEEIAKRLHKGKTEIELLLKLQQLDN